MATTKVITDLTEFNPGNPDYVLNATNAVTVINAGGNQYNFNGVYGKFGLRIGTTVLTGVPSGHPIAIINNGKTSQISYTGTSSAGTATGPDGNTYTFYYGDITITVAADFGTVSYYCQIHGYMGGLNNFVSVYSEAGLRMPTGGAFSGTPAEGMMRNDTTQASEGSASTMQHYNGTDWKNFVNTAAGTTCDCDYPTTSNGELLMQLDNNINNTCSGVTPTMGSGTATFSSTAKYGSYSFQGDGSRYIATNYSLTGKTNYTISIWFYNVNTGSSNQYIGGTTGDGTANLINGWLFNVRGSSASPAGYIDVIFRGGSSQPDIGRTTGGTTANDTWNNLCVAYNNGTATIYLNGSSSFSLTGGTNPQTSLGSGTHYDDLVIAAGGTNQTPSRWTGLLDQVRVYDSTLTQAEITSLQTETPC